jgi:hypothetical protein
VRAWLLAVALALAPSVAHADLDPARAAKQAEAATEKFGFCRKPPKKLSPRAVLLCPHAKATPGCNGFAAACDELDQHDKPLNTPKWLESILRLLAPVAQVVMWILVAAVVLALVVPLVLAWLRSRRDKDLKDEDEPKAARVEIAAAEEAFEVSDAEVLLARAGDHERRGELSRALSTYLAAALRGLDMRGSIRLERHRTNGEYVRACAEPTEKAALRAIARDVDHVEYGGQPATPEAVSGASKRAIALVRKLPLMLLLLVGCGSDALAPGSDPAGDDVLQYILREQGMTIARSGPIANLEIPAKRTDALLFDASRTPLDEESEPHLIRWVKSGGTLVLVGSPHRWPKGIEGKFAPSTSSEVRVTTWDDDEEMIYPAHIARAGGIDWGSGFPIAKTADDVTWAATRELGAGRIIGMAEADLVTNVGLARPDNAAALVAIMSLVDRTTLRIVRPEDGTTPPSNPFTALVRAGLGLGLGHALVATLLLFIAFGARRTRPTPSVPPRRRAFVEHVEATGALWARTRLSPHALSVYARWIEEQLRGQSHRVQEKAALFERAREARSDEPARGDELKTMKALGDLLNERKP